MNKFKTGDKVRRVSMELPCVPIGYETVVSPPPEGRSVSDRQIWYEWPIEACGYVLSDESHWELVLPDQALPVHTVTRQEIIPGNYGRVEVRIAGRDGVIDSHTNWVNLRVECSADWNASELRAAARVFVSLAEALEQE